jgi:hypothetical protein
VNPLYAYKRVRYGTSRNKTAGVIGKGANLNRRRNKKVYPRYGVHDSFISELLRQGRPSLIAPRTEPYERLYRIRLPPRISDEEGGSSYTAQSLVHSFPRTVSGECGIERCSPWPAPFSPQPPPKIARRCLAGSSILWRGPTPPERARPPCGFWPSRTGLVPLRAEALQRSPGSRACCLSACAGSKTTQDRLLARVYRETAVVPSSTRRESAS